MENEKPNIKRNITKENAREMQRKSAAARVKNKSWREFVREFGKMPIDVTLPTKGADGKNETQRMTWDAAVIVGAYRSAMKGDDKARQFIGLLNEQLNNTVQHEVSIKKEKELTPQEAAEFIAELDKRI